MRVVVGSVAALAVIVTAVGLAACSRNQAQGTLPTGAYGAFVRYGRDLVEQTPQLLPHNVGATMSCEACHISAGTKPHAGSWVGIYANFPEWNARSHRFIALQDRIAECFLYSVNGTPPAYTSREMEAITTYIAFLSKGQPVGTQPAGLAYEELKPDLKPDPQAGASVYSQRCSACHGADGGGRGGQYPPLWGAKSFNDAAGMHQLKMMAEFVRYNMPFGSPPNTLSAQEAYNVSAFVLSHPRPKFNGNRMIAFPALPAKDF